MPRDDTVNSLINQLKDSTLLANNVSNSNLEDFNLPKEELEQFVINNAGRLILECMETMQNYKDMITTAPNSEDVGAYSDLVSASTKALESLNKIIVQDKRSQTTITAKKLDMESKKQLIEILERKQIVNNIKLIKGDVTKTIPKFIKNNPRLKISFLNLDTDAYEPAVIILENLYPKIVKGGILLLDNYKSWPGETKAVDEYFKNKKIKIQKFDFSKSPHYIIKNS